MLFILFSVLSMNVQTFLELFEEKHSNETNFECGLELFRIIIIIIINPPQSGHRPLQFLAISLDPRLLVSSSSLLLFRRTALCKLHPLVFGYLHLIGSFFVRDNLYCAYS
jgi:hypothetical protein